MKETVSIIIPCRNEIEYIEKCILSIINANYPKDLLSVYVCDGMSSDGTRQMLDKLIRSYNYITVIENKKKTTPYAMNLGLRRSIADIKIILGAHSEISKEFINENIKVLNSSPLIGCSGGVLNSVCENKNSESIALAMSSPFGVGDASFRTGDQNSYVDTVAFGAYKKEVFEKIGFFDEELVRNQDDEFNFRMIKNGMEIYLSNTIKSTYYVRTSINKLFSQYYQYGYWKVYVNKKHNTITSLRQIVPLLFVLFLIIGGMTAVISPFARFTFVFLGLLYLTLGLFFASKKTTNIKHIIQMVPVFFVLHFSYGIGYLKGLTDFFLLNKPIKTVE